MSEKRRFSRIPFDATTHLIVDGETWVCQLIDISVKGALIHPPQGRSLAPGQKARLELHLSGEEVVIAMKMTVAHLTEHNIGLRCDEIDAESMSHLRRLVELNLGDEELLHRELSELGHSGPAAT